MRPLGLAEVSRTGVVAIARGPRRPAVLSFPTHNPYSKEERTMRVYYDRDADVNLIKAKKVAIIGYRQPGPCPCA